MHNKGRFSEWQPVRSYAEGIQPRIGKHWNGQPAWGVTAIYPMCWFNGNWTNAVGR